MSHVGQEHYMFKIKTIYLVMVVAVVGWIVSWYYHKSFDEYQYKYMYEIASHDSLVAVNDSLYKKMAVPIKEVDSLKKHMAWLKDVVNAKTRQIQNLTETVIHYKLLYLKGKANLDSISSTSNIKYYYFQKIYGMTTVNGRFDSDGNYSIGIKRAPLIIRHAFVRSDSGITVYTSLNDTTLKVVEQNNFYPYHIKAGPKYRFGYMAGVIVGPHPNIYVGLFGHKGKGAVGVGVGSGVLVFQYMREL